MSQEISDYILKVTCEMNNKIHTLSEEQYKLVLKPKPKWLPTFIYHWLLSQILTQEVRKRI